MVVSELWRLPSWWQYALSHELPNGAIQGCKASLLSQFSLSTERVCHQEITLEKIPGRSLDQHLQEKINGDRGQEESVDIYNWIENVDW